MKKRAFVALTGASGAIYGSALLRVLESMDIETYASSTSAALLNASEEMERNYSDIAEYLLDRGVRRTVILSENDIGARIASGSFMVDYYAVVPASMGIIGRIASGVSSTLIERCADVALKEKRPLVLLFREAPLSSIHLENLLKLSRAGAVIMPAAPAFYSKHESVDDLVDFIIGKILDAFRIENSLYKRWGDR